MSLFNAMKALKYLGNMQCYKEVIIETPLTTEIEGPANYVSEVPHPHGVPISMSLEDDVHAKSRKRGTGSIHKNPNVVEVQSETGRQKAWKSSLSTFDNALLNLGNVVTMEPLSDAAGPAPPTVRSEVTNTEVNLNHIGDDTFRIDSLKQAYLERCQKLNHEICSVNLRKAILYQSRSLLKIIIRAHDLAFIKNPRGQLVQRDKSNIINMLDIFRMSPLMIAVKVGNVKIVKLLLEYGADPLNISTSGETALSIGIKHYNEEMIEMLIEYGADVGVALCIAGLNRPVLLHKHHNAGINAPTMGISHYGFSFEPILMLSQPKFLLMTRNPVLTAFKVGTIINKIGDKRDEYLGDCDMLEQQTDDFAYYYLDQCRTMWEALLLLHDQQAETSQDLLDYALKKKKNKFISHHFCQQYMMDTWYGGVQRGRTANTIKKLFSLLLLHIIFPFFFIHLIYTFALDYDLTTYTQFANTRPMTLWRSLHVPVVSFVVDFINFLIMIVIMLSTCITTSYRKETESSNFWTGPEVFLWLCLAARFMVEIDKIRTQGWHFFKHIGNVVDLSVSMSIIFTVLLRIVAQTEAKTYVEDKMLLWSSYVYATAFLGLMLRMLEMLDITYTLGPLEGAISKMMTDVVKVCVLLVVCMIGFSVSMWTVTLQAYYYESNRENRNEATDGALSYPEYFSSFNTTVVTLLWSTLGLIEPDNIGITYNVNADTYLKVLWGAYIVTAMILFLNMLIAMLTETYVNVINNAETEWKFARSVVVMKYHGTHPFIFPFNLVLYPLFLAFHLFEAKIERKKIRQFGDEDEEAKRQSGFLHLAIKKRFKEKFDEILDIPYYYRKNVFNFYATVPMVQQKKKKKSSGKSNTRRTQSMVTQSKITNWSEDDKSSLKSD